MAIPRNRDEFKERILSELGEPVIKVNIADSQLDNAVDDAIDFYRDFHPDAQERLILQIQIPDDELQYQTIIDTNRIVMPPNVFAVMGIIDPNSINHLMNTSSSNFISDGYQFRKNLTFSMLDNNISLPVTQYQITRQYLADMNAILRHHIRYDFRYSHNSVNYLTFHDDISKYIKPGSYLYIECQGYLDKDKNLYGGRELRFLATAYAKKYWGMNLKKYTGMQLAGGMQLNGDSIYNDAINEIEKAETTIKSQMEPYGIVIA